MTSPVLTALLVIASMIVQPDDRDPKAMLRAAIETEEAISHGEIVFRFKASSSADLNLGLPRGMEPIPTDATIIFTFRDFRQFRIVVQDGDGASRTIVSDGEYIDMGNGELWEYRFLEGAWNSAINRRKYEFYFLMWPYHMVIVPQLFPMTKGHMADLLRPTSGTSLELTQEDADPPNTLSIKFLTPNGYRTGWFWRCVVLPEFGHRLTAIHFYVTGETNAPEEWGDPIDLGNDRYVMRTYRQPVFSSDDSDTSEIDLGASNFDHMPLESEFVIEHDESSRVVRWQPPNPTAQRIEMYMLDKFRWSIDVEPLVLPALSVVAVLIVVVAVFLTYYLAFRRSKDG